ncbi:MAG: glycosyltransferase [Terriglobales bacterium]|jgi:L-malate glycosyltransferase
MVNLCHNDGRMNTAERDRARSLLDSRSPSPKTPLPDGPPRKVFFLVDSLDIGGSESQAVELAVRLSAARYTVTLGCLRMRGRLLRRLQGAGISVVEFHPRGGIDSLRGGWQLLRLAAFLRREGFDIIHTHDLWSNLMGVPAAFLARVPVIISSQRDLSHLPWYQGGRRVWLRRIQGLSSVVLANAGPIREQLIQEGHLRAEKILVIHNGVDPEKFDRSSHNSPVSFPNAGDGKRIVLVGNMTSGVKGHSVLINAAPAIVGEFPDVRFVLAGDGTCRNQFETQVGDLGSNKHFLFLGRREDVPEILAACNIAVLPSKTEGLPNALLEYLAAGLATVATNAGGNAEIVEDGVTGLLVPPDNPEFLAAAVLRLLRDPDLACRLGRSGREFVCRRFGFDKLVEQIEGLYSELLRRWESTHR